MVSRRLHVYLAEHEYSATRCRTRRFVQDGLPARPALPAGAGCASATTRRASRNRRAVRQRREEGPRARRSRSRGLSTRGRGTYYEDKPPVFILADRGTGETYVHPAAGESTIRLLLDDHKEESLTVYTDGFRAYEPLDEDDAFDRQYVVHGEGEYADGDVHVNTCESHASLARRWLSPHQGVSKDKLTPYLRALQLRKRVRRKPGDEALKTILKTAL